MCIVSDKYTLYLTIDRLSTTDVFDEIDTSADEPCIADETAKGLGPNAEQDNSHSAPPLPLSALLRMNKSMMND